MKSFIGKRGSGPDSPAPDTYANKMHQKKTPHKHKSRNGALCALEVIRLLSFDSIATGRTEEGSTKSTGLSTPQTPLTISSDNDASTGTDTEERPRNNSKLLVHLPSPIPILNRSNSCGNQTSPSYLSSDTSSENEESRLFGDENVYPNFISFSSAHSCQPQSSPYASSTTKQLSVTTLDEWNRRCDEGGGVFLREHFTTSMLNLNLSQKKWSPLNEQRDRLNSQTLTNSYYGYNKDDWGDDISLTYSHV